MFAARQLTDEDRRNIKAAYGATVPPDVSVSVIPRGHRAFNDPAAAAATFSPRAKNELYWKNLRARAAARRSALPAAVAEGKTVPELAAQFQVGEQTIYIDLKALGLTAARPARPDAAPKRQARPKVPATRRPLPPRIADEKTSAPRETQRSRAAARRAELPALVESGLSAHDIADRFGLSMAAVYADLRALGLKAVVQPKERVPRSGSAVEASDGGEQTSPKVAPVRRATTDKARLRKEAQAEDHAAAVRDRRRFKTVPVPFGTPQVVTDAEATGSIFPTRVFDVVEHEFVLKDGAMNAKIGGDVLKGRLRGARILTLTLEERATCPRSCGHWRSCYGNAMQYARRWRHGPELEAAIRLELADLCRTHGKVLVRLHVLGDFYSPDYVALWLDLLDLHPGLSVFGFTSWKAGTPIGDALIAARERHGHRFSIRTSGMTGRWGSFTLDFPTAMRRVGDAIVCPEQAEAMEGKHGRHCGNCALCWQTDLPIAFVVH